MPPYTFMNRPAAKSLYFALTRDPFYITLEKHSTLDPESAREAMFRYLDYSLAEARDHGRVGLTPDQTSGAAIWSPPLDGQTQTTLSGRKKNFIKDQLGQTSLDIYCRIVDFMSDRSRDVVPDGAWYLSILGVDPDCQGRGLGKDLMAPVLSEIDRHNAACYAESFTPENFGFYLGLGFKKAKTIDEPVTGSAYTILVRNPASSKWRGK